MSDKKPSRIEEIKERLLTAAYAGASRRTPQEMQALIDEYTERGRAIPPSHEQALDAIDDEEPRGVRALNLREQADGSGRRYTGRLEKMRALSCSLN